MSKFEDLISKALIAPYAERNGRDSFGASLAYNDGNLCVHFDLPNKYMKDKYIRIPLNQEFFDSVQVICDMDEVDYVIPIVQSVAGRYNNIYVDLKCYKNGRGTNVPWNELWSDKDVYEFDADLYYIRIVLHVTDSGELEITQAFVDVFNPANADDVRRYNIFADPNNVIRVVEDERYELL